MLIRFSIENYLSFKERQYFSLLPGLGRLKAHHKTAPINGVSVLKSSVIFGANASGKSNLIKAIDFGKKMILEGTKPGQPISTDFFKLDKKWIDLPAYIEYEIQHKGKNYAYGFRFTTYDITSEWLYEIKKSGETKIFERKEKFDLDYLYKINPKKKEQQFLSFIAKGTPKNQLFLTQIRNLNVIENVTDPSDLLNVIDWFENSLTVIYPGSKDIVKKFALAKDTNLKQTFEELLRYFDTGINGIEFKKIDFEKIDIPDKIKQNIQKDLLNARSEKKVGFYSDFANDKYYIISRDNKKGVKAEALRTKHDLEGGEFALFELENESDGTRRIMDLIPLIIDFFVGGNVFIVDEIERSLHPNLIKDLFTIILERCSNVNSQLIASTHESILMNQKILRKDEIWFSVKRRNGATELYSLEDYNVRFDKNIKQDYLLGRYRGVPKFGNKDELSLPLKN